MKFNPEARMLSHSETRLSESQEALYPFLVPENEAKAMKMEDFRDLYEGGVDRDLETVKEFEKKMAENDQRKGKAESSMKSGKFFEAVVNYGIDKAGFLGPDATPIVPSKFDDYIRKIDTIVEFENEESTSHFALGMDVTRSREAIREKFDGVRGSINSGELYTAKYFKSTNHRGELRNIIRVVVGADQPVIDSISDLILSRIRLQKSIKASGVQEDSLNRLRGEYEKKSIALGEHPLQWIILKEIVEQLEVFLKYAEKLNKPEIASQCSKILSIINRVIEEKTDGKILDDDTILSDQVYKLIHDEVESF